MADLHVGSGQTYATIQAAINAAGALDTIVVHAGTYNESININKAVTLQSVDGAAATIINGQGTSPGFSFSVQINSNGVTFGTEDHGFTVNAGVQETAGIFIGAKSDIVIEDNVINGNATATHLRQGVLGSGGMSNVTFEGNTFGGGATQLVYINGTPSVSVMPYVSMSSRARAGSKAERTTWVPAFHTVARTAMDPAAWNSGAMINHRVSGRNGANAWKWKALATRLRWVSITPFEAPVVPPV